MKTLWALGLALLSVSTIASAASQQDDSARPALAPPKDDVMIIKASTGYLYANRMEITSDGKVVERYFSLVTPEGQPGYRGVDPSTLHWQETKTKSYPSLNPESVMLLTKAPWLTPEERETYKDKLKPIVRVAPKPACDAVESTVSLRNTKTGELLPIYVYTADCGEVEWIQYDRNDLTPAIINVLKLERTLDLLKDSK